MLNLSSKSKPGYLSRALLMTISQMKRFVLLVHNVTPRSLIGWLGIRVVIGYWTSVWKSFIFKADESKLDYLQ